MKILIIAAGRSGGHQLNKWLALELGYKMIHEPTITKKTIEGDNIVVKYLLSEVQNSVNIDYANWDKIIGLTREDVMECAISLTNVSQTKKYRSSYEISNEWLESNKEHIEHFKKMAEGINKSINEIETIKLKVTYEKIYYTKEDIQRIKDYVGLTNTKYEHLLDNTNRLRKLL